MLFSSWSMSRWTWSLCTLQGKAYFVTLTGDTNTFLSSFCLSVGLRLTCVVLSLHVQEFNVYPIVCVTAFPISFCLFVFHPHTHTHTQTCCIAVGCKYWVPAELDWAAPLKYCLCFPSISHSTVCPQEKEMWNLLKKKDFSVFLPHWHLVCPKKSTSMKTKTH